MDPSYYRLLHVAGVLMLFLGLGGIFAHEVGKAPRLFTALHGIGLLVMLIAGIGFAHAMKLGWPNWLLAKIAVWVLFGALPALMKRGVLPRSLAVLLALALGGVAYWLVKNKPF